jgi:hypothetical protein
MHALQVQINEIGQKVDQLQVIVQQLGNHLMIMSAAEKASPSTLAAEPNPEQSAISSPTVPLLTEHKDIISDDCMDSSFFLSGSDAFLTADIQIRRLTAQLTAAYNRIAALEEQLMAKRSQN